MACLHIVHAHTHTRSARCSTCACITSRSSASGKRHDYIAEARARTHTHMCRIGIMNQTHRHGGGLHSFARTHTHTRKTSRSEKHASECVVPARRTLRIHFLREIKIIFFFSSSLRRCSLFSRSLCRLSLALLLRSLLFCLHHVYSFFVLSFAKL